VQYLRRCSLVVAGEGGDGLDLSALRCVFSVKRSDAQSPNAAEIKVYNLADATARRVRDEFRRVVLSAGYGDDLGVIFDGSIKQVRLSRENGVDAVLAIAAADGDVAYTHGVVSATLAAGATQGDQVAVAVAGMNEHGVELGHVSGLPAAGLPRGKVLYGMSRDYLRQSVESSAATWSIQDGRVQILPRTGVLPGEAVVLSAGSGLVGMAEQTDKGIKAKCLLNPAIRAGGLVKLDNRSILEAALDLTPASSGSAPADPPAALAADGLYRVLAVEYEGDTRGGDWYSIVTCLAADGSAPAGEEVDPE
jgi:hypothetical protein